MRGKILRCHQWHKRAMMKRLQLEKYHGCWTSRDLSQGWLPWALRGGKQTCGAHRGPPKMTWAMSPPEWWSGSKVLSDFDVLWAEKYNKRSQMVWRMRIHHNEIDKVTGKIRQICQVGRIRNNSRNVGTSWLSKFLGVTLTREKKLTVRSYYCIYFSLCVDLSPWVECNLNERHFGN